MKRFLLPIICFLTSCSTSNPLERALSYAGDNRNELTAVLEHYAQNQRDSLKLMASKYLIENMPGHYSITDKMTLGFFRKVETDYPNITDVKKIALFSLPQFYMASKRGAAWDIHHITADFLIHHIDNVFSIYGDKITQIPFNIFCEYLLPYRISNEPLNYLMRNKTWLEKELLDGIRHFDLSFKEADNYFTLYYNKVIQDTFYKLNLPFPVNNEIVTNGCILKAFYQKMRNNILGIPSAIFFTPHFHNKNGRHYWINTIYEVDNIKRGARMARNDSKVYLVSYGVGKRPFDYGGELIPPDFLFLNLLDVTRYASDVFDVVIKMDFGAFKPRYSYLAVFNELEWRPVAWTENNKNKGTFYDMGREVLYQPIYYDSIQQYCAGYPFYLSKNGDIKTFLPDTTMMQKLILTRKYPLAGNQVDRIMSMQDIHVISANNKDFNNADTLGRLVYEPWQPYYEISSMSYFKFLRLANVRNKVSSYSIAEIRLIDGHKDRAIEIKPINQEKLFDEDLLTNESFNKVLDIEFPEPINPSKIQIFPHTDENDIYPGDTYELFYADSNGWKSLGMKVPSVYFLEYDNVPSGALFWLHNHTKGKEERPFSYEKGHIVFY